MLLHFRPHLRGDEVIEEIEHALTKWSKYGVDMPRAVRLELCKVHQHSNQSSKETSTVSLWQCLPVYLPFTTKPPKNS